MGSAPVRAVIPSPSKRPEVRSTSSLPGGGPGSNQGEAAPTSGCVAGLLPPRTCTPSVGGFNDVPPGNPATDEIAFSLIRLQIRVSLGPDRAPRPAQRRRGGPVPPPARRWPQIACVPSARSLYERHQHA